MKRYWLNPRLRAGERVNCSASSRLWGERKLRLKLNLNTQSGMLEVRPLLWAPLPG